MRQVARILLPSEEVVVEERVARLESDVAHIRTDIAEGRAELKSEIAALRADSQKPGGSIRFLLVANTVACMLGLATVFVLVAIVLGWF